MKRALLLPGIMLAAAACARPLPELAPSQVAEPAASDVESVVFLFGDAGYADATRNPVLVRLAADVEAWSSRLGRDSAVVVLFLGDIVYPWGMREAGHAERARDSVIVQNQVALVAGPSAQQFGAAGYFLAGNHDWGEARLHGGMDRLRNLESFLDRRREAGPNVRLLPSAGVPGPAVVDVGERLRLLLYDTAWWLLVNDTAAKAETYRRTEEAIRGAGGREIIIAAHHPYVSASSHGGLVPFWNTLGLRFLLHRSGAILQDLTSARYRELLAAMRRSFGTVQPLLFAGGHDHNLQVIEGDGAPHPRFSVVSGSGSKVSAVGDVAGMRFRRAAPGYMRVVVHRSGQVDLFVVAAPDRRWLACPGTGAVLAECMGHAVDAFRPAWSARIR